MHGENVVGEEEKKNEAELVAEQLWREHQGKIRSLCEFKLRSCPDEVDEVISEAYLSLCIKLNEGKISNPKAWLYSTVNNMIKITYKEQAKNRANIVSLDAAGANMHNLIYITADFTEKNLSNDEIDILKEQVLSSLPPDDRRFIEMIYDEHLKYKKIAEILNTTENAVKQRSYRVRGEIKKLAKEKTKNYK